MKFRSDINGLRALAVLPVLFFHAGLPLFTGGFLGVDVFFVISGYLITEQILVSLNNGTFSFAKFYDNRIRRIIPALLTISTITTVLCFYFMLPYNLKNYGQSLVATMLSANNILLYITSGYWNVASDFKPLYHTWSLGVEEQYYFFAPLLLYIIYNNIGRQSAAIKGVLALLLVASFAFTLFINDMEFKFLFIFFRAWELLAGALLALSMNKNGNSQWLSALGLFLLLFSYVKPDLLGSNQALVVVAPVLGTCLIIRFSNTDNIVGKTLSLRPLTFIGLISYSIYLWHQPVLAFVRLSSIQKPQQLELLAWLLLALPLGYLSWRYVENIFRSKTAIPPKLFYTLITAGIGLNLIVGALLYTTYGLQRLTPKFSYGINPQIYVEKPRELQRNSFGNAMKIKYLVIGTSFARDYINMLRETGNLESKDVVYTDADCTKIESGFVDFLLANSDRIIFSDKWGERPMGSNISDEVNELRECYQYMRKKSHSRVFVLGTKNFGWNNDFAKLSQGNLAKIRVLPVDNVAYFNIAAKAAIGEDYIDIMSLITDSAGRVPISTPEEKFLTYDTHHLTPHGARYIGDLVFSRYGFLVQ